jgi:hypothetical protein
MEVEVDATLAHALLQFSEIASRNLPGPRKPEMPQLGVRNSQMQVVRAAEVRRSLTPPGDIRSEIAFQNDINALLARFDELKVPWQPLGGTLPALPPSVVADTTPVPALRPPRRGRGAEPGAAASGKAQRLRVLEGGAPMLDLIAPVLTPVVRVVAPEPTPTPTLVPRPAAAPARAAGGRAPRRRA